jgi:hypothetical protein
MFDIEQSNLIFPPGKNILFFVIIVDVWLYNIHKTGSLFFLLVHGRETCEMIEMISSVSRLFFSRKEVSCIHIYNDCQHFVLPTQHNNELSDSFVICVRREHLHNYFMPCVTWERGEKGKASTSINWYYAC